MISKTAVASGEASSRSLQVSIRAGGYVDFATWRRAHYSGGLPILTHSLRNATCRSLGRSRLTRVRSTGRRRSPCLSAPSPRRCTSCSWISTCPSRQDGLDKLVFAARLLAMPPSIASLPMLEDQDWVCTVLAHHTSWADSHGTELGNPQHRSASLFRTQR